MHRLHMTGMWRLSIESRTRDREEENQMQYPRKEEDSQMQIRTAYHDYFSVFKSYFSPTWR